MLLMTRQKNPTKRRREQYLFNGFIFFCLPRFLFISMHHLLHIRIHHHRRHAKDEFIVLFLLERFFHTEIS